MKNLDKTNKDYIGSIGLCVNCNSEILLYTCNKFLHELRSKSNEWDYWAACSNPLCNNSFGEGIFQNDPSFLKIS